MGTPSLDGTPLLLVKTKDTMFSDHYLRPVATVWKACFLVHATLSTVTPPSRPMMECEIEVFTDMPPYVCPGIQGSASRPYVSSRVEGVPVPYLCGEFDCEPAVVAVLVHSLSPPCSLSPGSLLLASRNAISDYFYCHCIKRRSSLLVA